MSAGYTELFMEQAASFSTTITVSDIYGEVFNLSGYTAHSQMKKSYYSTSPTANFVCTIDAQLGTITLALSINTTINISPGRYVYDVILRKNDDASITRILEGIVNVSPAVTRL
jgi:hypothetical protein